jgi:hypothetical protein
MLLNPFYEANIILIPKPAKDMQEKGNDSQIFLMDIDTKLKLNICKPNSTPL